MFRHIFSLKKGRPCFVAEIEAWSIGPVVPEAYKVFEQYGGCNIPMINNERIGRKIIECQFKQADEKDIKEIKLSFTFISIKKKRL